MSRSVKLLLIASSLWYFGEGLLGPLFAVFTEKVGGDLLDITWAWSVYLIVTGICYFLVGKIFNRSRYKYRLIIFGYALNTLFTFGYMLVNSVEGLLVVQVGLGIAEAISTPSWTALFASEMEEAEDTFLWGLASGHSHVVEGIAIALGGLIAFYLSFDTLFFIMGCIQLLATFIQSKIICSKYN